jgi:hypothetical protein
MPKGKKIDKEKEQAFIDYFVEGETAGNASQSAIKCGYSKDMKGIRSMGSYLKKKYSEEIRKKQEDRISSSAGPAISVLQSLLHSEQDAVKLNTARLILELGNFSSQTINLNVDKIKEKTDAELIEELNSLMKIMPKTTKNIVREEDIAPDLSDGVPLIKEDKVVKH